MLGGFTVTRWWREDWKTGTNAEFNILYHKQTSLLEKKMKSSDTLPEGTNLRISKKKNLVSELVWANIKERMNTMYGGGP